MTTRKFPRIRRRRAFFPRLPLFLCLFVLLPGALTLSGCTSGQDTAQTEDARDNTPEVLIPTADGESTIGDDLVTIDTSHTDQGYIMAAYYGDASQVNIQVTGPDDVTYLYFISETEQYTGIPLSAGDGSYCIDVYENVGGEVYSSLFSEEISVELENEFLPFLYSNQFVYFTEDTKAIAKGEELAEGCTSDLEVVTAVYNYVVDNTEYDYTKAKNVTSPYYPDVDETLENKTGICFDYSALMCTMLRTQRIPCKLDIGYADGVYHAWISAYIDDIGWVDNIIEFNGTDWSMMDPTYASTEGRDKEQDTGNYYLMYQR